MIKKTLKALLAVGLMCSLGTSAQAIEIVANGGFETGNLTGWSTSALGTTGTCPSANRDWNVSSSSSTGCSTVANPVGSTYAAYVMNDGTANTTYRLFQTLDLTGVTSGILSFDWASVNGSDASRTLSVFLAGTQIWSSSTSGNFSWTNVSLNVSSVLAANTGGPVNLEFANFIPSRWSGAAGLGLDNVSINTTAPEPSTLALIGLGLAGIGWKRRKAS